MGLTAGLGNAGLRPGVCTSTSRPASPYDGQVIYETDTDRTLIFDGTTWEVLGTGVFTSSTRPSSPFDGQSIYETDTDRVMAWNGSSWVIVSAPGFSSADPASSPQVLQNAGLPNGFYWLRGGSMTSAVQMFVQMNLQGSLPYCRVFKCGTNTNASLNLLGQNIPMSRLLVQREDTGAQSWGAFSSVQVYNSNSSTSLTTSSGSANVGRAYLGFAGGHGLYETSQGVCNWGNLLGGVAGAGYNGSSCGTYPDALVMGTTQAGTTTYSNLDTYRQWEHWVHWS